MHRRAFLASLLAVAAAGAAASASPAQASTLLDELNALDCAQDRESAADLPAQGATPAQYYGRRRYRPRRAVYYRPRRVAYYRPVRRRRVVCQTRVNRWGQLVRRCF